VGPEQDPIDRQLMQLLTEGSTNAEMGAALGLDADGVAQRLARLLGQLGASTRAEATSLAFRGLAR
jgi:DNA-binding NarL/FixJ family response regulator